MRQKQVQRMKQNTPAIMPPLPSHMTLHSRSSLSIISRPSLLITASALLLLILRTTITPSAASDDDGSYDPTTVRCTGPCSAIVCTQTTNRQSQTKAIFSLTYLNFQYPVFHSRDYTLMWDYTFSLCDIAPVPVNKSGGEIDTCRAEGGNQNEAVWRYDLARPEEAECLPAGRTTPGTEGATDTSRQHVELLIDSQYTALGPLGLHLNFTNGKVDTRDNGECPVSRAFSVLLRCPYWLNGMAPDPITNEQKQPNSTVATPFARQAFTRIPVVSDVSTVNIDGACLSTVTIDSIYACPLACLPSGGVGVPLDAKARSDPPAIYEECGGRGICREISATTGEIGCLCNQDADGAGCQGNAGSILGGNPALTPMSITSLVLLLLTIILTFALFRKLKYLNRADGHTYGNLAQPGPGMEQ